MKNLDSFSIPRPDIKLSLHSYYTYINYIKNLDYKVRMYNIYLVTKSSLKQPILLLVIALHVDSRKL